MLRFGKNMFSFALPIAHTMTMNSLRLNISTPHGQLKKAFLLLLIVSGLICMCPNPVLQAFQIEKNATPRYIFLFIGDGMGPRQVKLSDAVLQDGQSLVMTSFPVHGQATSHADNNAVTDSAAAGTALATGRKTSIGTISMATNHIDTLRTVTDIAQSKGMKTGIVTSAGIDDATPACFYAHNISRNNYYDIAVQMASSGVDYFGGGYAFGNFPEQIKKAKTFQGDIRSLMQSANYVIAHNRTELSSVQPGSRCWAYTDYDIKAGMNYDMDRTSRDIELAEFTREGIRVLNNPQGFFMMVEGGKIDWACHAHDAAAAAHDVMAFDNAIAEALAFYHHHPAETLIIVTADHETGGLTLEDGSISSETQLKLLRNQSISQQGFTEKVSLWRKSNSVTFPMALDSVRVYYGLRIAGKDSSLVLTALERDTLMETYKSSMKQQNSDNHGKESADIFTRAVTNILNRRAGVSWSTHNHTGAPVEVFARGNGAEAFRGSYDNTDIAKKLYTIMTCRDQVTLQSR